MSKTPIHDRLRTAWNTLIDHPGAHVELSFGELPPRLLAHLEEEAEESGKTLGEVCYDALTTGIYEIRNKQGKRDYTEY